MQAGDFLNSTNVEMLMLRKLSFEILLMALCLMSVGETMPSTMTGTLESSYLIFSGCLLPFLLLLG